MALSEDIVFDTPWQTGDVVLLDNFLVMHGRRPFTGTRKWCWQRWRSKMAA